jgi:hypothetical protein
MGSNSAIPRLLGASVAAAARHDSERMAAMAALAQHYQQTLQQQQQQQQQQSCRPGEPQQPHFPGVREVAGAVRLAIPVQQGPTLTLVSPSNAINISPNISGVPDHLQEQSHVSPALPLPLLQPSSSAGSTVPLVGAVMEAISTCGIIHEGSGGALRGSINSMGSSSFGGTVGSNASGGSGASIIYMDPPTFAPPAPAAGGRSALHLTTPHHPSSASSSASHHPLPFTPGQQQPLRSHHLPQAATAPASRQHSSDSCWPEQQTGGFMGGWVGEGEWG